MSTDTAVQPLALDAERAATTIGVKADTLRVWRRDGRGPRYILIGRQVRYRPADIDAWLLEHQVIPESVVPQRD